MMMMMMMMLLSSEPCIQLKSTSSVFHFAGEYRCPSELLDSEQQLNVSASIARSLNTEQSRTFFVRADQLAVTSFDWFVEYPINVNECVDKG